MAWCPVCKLEYVEGVTVCPDCKSALVDNLNEDSVTEENLADDKLIHYDFYNKSDEDDNEAAAAEAEIARLEMIERMRGIMDNPPYKSKEDALSENKSGAFVLIVFGIIGVGILLLNALGIISLPFYGYSLNLVYIVMGTLFAVFFISGIRSLLKIKKLKPEVVKEKEDIDKVVSFIREKCNNGAYRLDKDNYEESYLQISNTAVKDVEEAFPDLEKGFAFYIVDRFGSDIFDED